MERDLGDLDLDAAALADVRGILSEVDGSDFERLDPPPELWQRIQGSIASDAAMSRRLPPGSDPGAGVVVDYWIDSTDVIVDVGGSWSEFARDNGAPELVDPAPSRTIWTYFDTDETKDLWKLLVERVRDRQTPAHVPFRCDAPHMRRWFDMTITPAEDGRVHFNSRLAFEEPRPAVPLLEADATFDANLQPVAVCGWCSRGRYGDAWLDIEELVHVARLLEQPSMPPVSHGVCASCAEAMAAELLVPAG